MEKPMPCKDAPFGSYMNHISVDLPPHMQEYRRMLNPDCCDKQISVDECIADELKEIWAEGITTTGSCCGHFRYAGEVFVIEKDIEKMEQLGYKHQVNPMRPKDKDCFYWKKNHHINTKLKQP
jgi:hypothetical protein